MTEFRVVRYIYCTSDDYNSSMIKYFSLNRYIEYQTYTLFRYFENNLNANKICYN